MSPRRKSRHRVTVSARAEISSAPTDRTCDLRSVATGEAEPAHSPASRTRTGPFTLARKRGSYRIWPRTRSKPIPRERTLANMQGGSRTQQQSGEQPHRPPVPTRRGRARDGRGNRAVAAGTLTDVVSGPRGRTQRGRAPSHVSPFPASIKTSDSVAISVRRRRSWRAPAGGVRCMGRREQYETSAVGQPRQDRDDRLTDRRPRRSRAPCVATPLAVPTSRAPVRMAHATAASTAPAPCT